MGAGSLMPNHPNTNQLITFLQTDRFEETVVYYTETLGFELALSKAHCRIIKVSPGAFLGICESENPMPDTRRVTVSIQSRDIDGWYEKVTAAGLKTDGVPRRSEAYGINHFFTWDPSGYSVEFQEFFIPEWDHDA